MLPEMWISHSSCSTHSGKSRLVLTRPDSPLLYPASNSGFPCPWPPRPGSLFPHGVRGCFRLCSACWCPSHPLPVTRATPSPLYHSRLTMQLPPGLLATVTIRPPRPASAAQDVAFPPPSAGRELSLVLNPSASGWIMMPAVVSPVLLSLL